MEALTLLLRGGSVRFAAYVVGLRLAARAGLRASAGGELIVMGINWLNTPKWYRIDVASGNTFGNAWGGN